MKKNILAIICVLSFSIANANEGMWILPNIPDSVQNVMDNLGYELKIKDIYSETTPSLKDAVVSLSNGYSGVTVSKDGLFLTNYDCIYSFLKDSNNYVEQGFLAASYGQEIPLKNLAVTFIRSTEDVTKKILSHISEFESPESQKQIIDSISNSLVIKKESETGYKAEIKATNKGNNYYLYTYERFSDIRLVYAPPMSIALFGKGKDEWKVPRHNANFAVLRIYSSQKNQPDFFEESNKPYKPKYFAQISTHGYEADDFVFSLGFPGKTDRQITSYELAEKIHTINRAEIESAQRRNEVWDKAIFESNYVRNRYEPRYLENKERLDYLIALQESVEKQSIIKQKQEEEQDFVMWITKTDFNTMLKYENIIPSLEKIYTNRQPYTYHLNYLNESLGKIGIINVGCMLLDITPQFEKDIYLEISKFYETYDEYTDKKMLIAMLQFYAEKANINYMPDIYDIINKKYKGNIEKYVNDIFEKSFLSQEIKFMKYLDKPTDKQFKNDPIIQLSKSINDKRNEFASVVYSYNKKIEKNNSLYIEGFQEKNPQKTLMPDANYTLRMSFGKIQTYSPSDGIFFGYASNFEGILEKVNTQQDAYKIDEKFKNTYLKTKKKNPKDDLFKISFMSTCDVPAEKMGGPVFNADGKLIGIMSDGNYEAISNIYQYNEKFQRTIALDINYILFILKKYANATRIVDKLMIVDE